MTCPVGWRKKSVVSAFEVGSHDHMKVLGVSEKTHLALEGNHTGPLADR